MFSSRFVRAAVFIAFIASAPSRAFAHSGSSAISGFVKDGTGTALPGATVKIVNAETRVLVEVVTNGEGAPFILQISQTIAIDFTLGVGRQEDLVLPVDAMQEFRVITNNYSAEFGHSTGGVVAMSTRSGTNAFRGSLFESFRNDGLDASNFFAASKPPINLNQLQRQV